nr:MAG TPA: hypothetical protein [Caudoviricetes sp.]DAT45220.1 MAG TPA: hypothetical protein [Caudoviricetes sp.]
MLFRRVFNFHNDLRYIKENYQKKRMQAENGLVFSFFV